MHQPAPRDETPLRNGHRKPSYPPPNSNPPTDPSNHKGYPEDLLVSIALGADMFDCVWPTRTARFGNAITRRGVVNLKHASYAHDFGPIDSDCDCLCCRDPDTEVMAADDSGREPGLGVTRAYIHHLAAKETVGAHL